MPGPEQWKAILGFTLEFPQATPRGGGSNPVPPAAFSLSESPVDRADDLWVWVVPKAEFKLPVVLIQGPEITIPPDYSILHKPFMDLIDNTRGPLPQK